MDATERPLIDPQLQNPIDFASATGPEPLQLILTQTQELDSCPFWVSLYRSGPLTPPQLFQIPSNEGIFQVLTHEGLSEKQPLMLSDNREGQPTRQFYLIPEQQCREQPEITRDLIVSTLEALGPDRVGLYLSSTQLQMELTVHLIEEICLGISFLRTKELHLYVGELGMNPLLNAALRVKVRLEGRRNVIVYH